jgi:hypothetical protein
MYESSMWILPLKFSSQTSVYTSNLSHARYGDITKVNTNE